MTCNTESQLHNDQLTATYANHVTVYTVIEQQCFGKLSSKW